MNRNAKPKTNSPIDLRELFPEKKSGRAKAKRGRANAAISTLKPRAEISHAVTVVPMLAPMMIPIACATFIIPEFTNPTTITVVAEDD